MLKMRLPEKSKMFGPDRIMLISDRIGQEATLTDMAIITGANSRENQERRNVPYDATQKGLIGLYYTIDSLKQEVCYTSYDATIGTCNNYNIKDWYGVRPIISYDTYEELQGIVSEIKDMNGGVKRGYVYIPVYAAERDIQKHLKELKKTGGLNSLEIKDVRYPVYSENVPEENSDFKYYRYNGEIYLLARANLCKNENGKITNQNDRRLTTISNVDDGENIFIKVEATEIYIDEKNKEAYFYRILFSGVPINAKENKYPENWDESDMGEYFKKYLKELQKLQQTIRKLKGKGENSSNNDTSYVNQFHKLNGELEAVTQYMMGMLNGSKENSEKSGEEIE